MLVCFLHPRCRYGMAWRAPYAPLSCCVHGVGAPLMRWPGSGRLGSLPDFAFVCFFLGPIEWVRFVRFPFLSPSPFPAPPPHRQPTPTTTHHHHQNVFLPPAAAGQACPLRSRRSRGWCRSHAPRHSPHQRLVPCCGSVAAVGSSAAQAQPCNTEPCQRTQCMQRIHSDDAHPCTAHGIAVLSADRGGGGAERRADIGHWAVWPIGLSVAHRRAAFTTAHNT